uniref:Ig-like domain-containing protein n=1 Tax=Equus asinus asinus TaxID=83772 RepID=A0A8C4MYF0_EQUAS
QGDPATLQVKFSGTKEITAKWFKGGQELTLGQKYKISVTDTVSILKIISTEKKDSGEYTFEVQNDVGRSSCRANLIIPPSFTKKLKKMDSIKGSSIDLECIVAGSHPISIQWFKDDQEISASEKYKYSFHDNTAFLEISHLEGTDSGTYTCSATNKAGHNQCSGHLTVKEPPYFVEKPQSQDVNPNTRVQLKALVGGTAPMTIKWFKDNKELHSGALRKQFCTLVFVLKNVPYHAFSSSLEPPQFIKKPSPVLVLRNGQSTTFECQITGTPEIRVSWYLDGNEITAIRKHGISFVDGLATFQISGARVENSGTYVCEARNDAGTASCSIQLKVKEPPSFIRELQPVEVVKDSDVELECEVMGTSPFEVTWLKNNREIRSSKKYTLSDRVSVFYLHITKCDPSDTGEYQCIISNEGGSCSCSARVSLKEPPSFIKKIENVTTVLKSSATFQSTVAGSPPISVTWLKDDQILDEDDNVHISFVNNVATLQIRTVDNGHSGRYTCQAKNESGVERCYAFLLVQGL